ncbi:hypothetical protein N2152v2_002622 [Parachlorella kessleri]
MRKAVSDSRRLRSSSGKAASGTSVTAHESTELEAWSSRPVNSRGRSALHMAAWQGDLATVEALLQSGAKPDVLDQYGSSPLHGAAWQGHASVITALIQAGAPVDARDRDGVTSLHCAAREGRAAAVLALLAAGANPKLRVSSAGIAGCFTPRYGDKGSPSAPSAAELAERRGHADITQLLHQAEASTAELEAAQEARAASEESAAALLSAELEAAHEVEAALEARAAALLACNAELKAAQEARVVLEEKVALAEATRDALALDLLMARQQAQTLEQQLQRQAAAAAHALEEQQAAAAQQVEELQKQFAELECQQLQAKVREREHAEVADLKAELAEAASRHASEAAALQAQLGAAEAQLTSLRAAVAQAANEREVESAAAKALLADAQQEVEALNAQLAAAQDAHAAEVAALQVQLEAAQQAAEAAQEAVNAAQQELVCRLEEMRADAADNILGRGQQLAILKESFAALEAKSAAETATQAAELSAARASITQLQQQLEETGTALDAETSQLVLAHMAELATARATITQLQQQLEETGMALDAETSQLVWEHEEELQSLRRQLGDKQKAALLHEERLSVLRRQLVETKSLLEGEAVGRARAEGLAQQAQHEAERMAAEVAALEVGLQQRLDAVAAREVKLLEQQAAVEKLAGELAGKLEAANQLARKTEEKAQQDADKTERQRQQLDSLAADLERHWQLLESEVESHSRQVQHGDEIMERRRQELDLLGKELEHRQQQLEGEVEYHSRHAGQLEQEIKQRQQQLDAMLHLAQEQVHAGEADRASIQHREEALVAQERRAHEELDTARAEVEARMRELARRDEALAHAQLALAAREAEMAALQRAQQAAQQEAQQAVAKTLQRCLSDKLSKKLDRLQVKAEGALQSVRSNTPAQEMSAQMMAMKEKLAKAEELLEEQRQRSVALAPYLVTAPKRGVISNSRYAQRLRREIVQASRDKERKPVLIFGEPGLEKDNIAALIHFGGPEYSKPMVQVNCEDLDDSATPLTFFFPFFFWQVNCEDLDDSATLLYGMGQKRGLLYWLRDGGTLLLNNVDKAKPAIMPLLKQVAQTHGSLASYSLSMDEEGDHQGDGGSAVGPQYWYGPRILLTEEKHVPTVEAAVKTVIKVPPLRVRASDIKELASYFLKRIAKARGLGNLTLTPEAVRQLESYSYPLNVKELQSMIERAATQAAGSSTLLTEEVFWGALQTKDRYRWNLLKAFPWFREFLRSEWWTEKINFQFVSYVFAAVVTILFVCPQDRGHNFALNVFWAYWWPLIFIIYPFIGRVWCAVCPFMIYGELVQRWRLATGAKLMKWPKEVMEDYGPWFLFSLFYAILIWEEVWDLPNTAYLSSFLLLLITAGAMVGSFFFERRIWCRYLCPIGGMNGLFAKLAMTELRARQGVCSSTCTTYTCYKGGPAIPPEGMESVGCPIYSHPAQLVDNKNCVLCMECLKACPHRSVEFRLRPPGVELWTSHKATPAEAALMFMLLGAVPLHHLPQLMEQFGLDPTPVYLDQGAHIAASALVLALPGALCYAADWAWRRVHSMPGAATAPGTQPPRPAVAAAAAGGGNGVAPQSAAQQGSDGVAGSQGKEGKVFTGVATTSRAPPPKKLLKPVPKPVRKAIQVLKNALPAAADPPPQPQGSSKGKPGTASTWLGVPGSSGSSGGAAAAAGLAAWDSSGVQPFVEACYGYLPLVWAGTLAHYLHTFLNEAGEILPVTAATFGLDGEWLPAVQAHPAVTSFLQGATLLLGCTLSLLLTVKIGGGRHPWRRQAHQLGLIVLLTAELWSLIVTY